MHPFEQQFEHSWPVAQWCDVSVVAAVSGGADSVAMLRALVALKRQAGGEGTLHVVHVDHRLRGDQSAGDARFVESLCDDIGVSRTIVRLPEIDAKELQGQGLESILRRKRYAVMTEQAEHIGARYLVTAHSADDQAETILHRVIRGTGIRGLAGIPRTRRLSHAVTLIRPMLEIRREEIIRYLDDLGQSYRTDASNTDRRFTRNRIRCDLLPKLAADYNSGVVDALLRLGRQADAVKSLVNKQVSELVDRAVSEYHAEIGERIEDGFKIDTSQLTDVPRDMVRHLLIASWRTQDWPLRDMSYDHWEQLAVLIEETPVEILPEDYLKTSYISRNSQSEFNQVFPGAIKVQKKGIYIIFYLLDIRNKNSDYP